jgi:hypothetical protein
MCMCGLVLTRDMIERPPCRDLIDRSGSRVEARRDGAMHGA